MRHEVDIEAGGVVKDVTFVDADPEINHQIDAAYRKQQLGSSLELTSHCCKYRRTRPKTNWQLSNSRLDPNFFKFFYRLVLRLVGCPGFHVARIHRP